MITAYTEGLAVVLRAWGARWRATCFLIDQVMHNRHSLDPTELHASMRFDGFGLGFFRAAIIQEHAKTLACVWHRITTDCGPENLSLAPA